MINIVILTSGATFFSERK